jgi:hypothetical protein
MQSVLLHRGQYQPRKEADGMRRRRASTQLATTRLTDETGQPITFATPGNPTPEERRRYALAVQRATSPAPLSPEQDADRRARMQRRRDLLGELGVYVGD